MNLLIKNTIIPNKPGVYIIKNTKKHIIYIGKAKNLKKRLNSYKSTRNTKTEIMKKEAFYLELKVLKDENEAILEELRLINLHKPKYNIISKEERGLYFLDITKSEYPAFRIKRINKKTKELSNIYSLSEIKTLNKIIKEYYKLRDCSDSFFKKRNKPCNEYDLNLCSAPCVKKTTKDDYLKSVNNVIKLTNGDGFECSSLENKIKKNVKNFTKNENYKLAKTENEKIKIIDILKKTKEIIYIFQVLQTDKYKFLSVSCFFNKNKTNKEFFKFDLYFNVINFIKKYLESNINKNIKGFLIKDVLDFTNKDNLHKYSLDKE